MRKEMKENIKKALALILTASMSLSMNMTAFADEIVVESSDNSIVVEEALDAPTVETVEEDKAEDIEVISDEEQIQARTEVINEEKSESEILVEGHETVTEEVIQEEIVENSPVVEEVEGVEGEKEVIELTEDGEATVQLEDQYLIKYLAIYYGEKNSEYEDAFYLLDESRTVGGTKLKTGEIRQSDLEKVTKLDFYIDFNVYSANEFSAEEYNKINFGKDIAKFTKLEELSITKADDRFPYEFPELNIASEDDSITSLKKLSMTGLEFRNANDCSASIDVSKITNLEEFVFTSNKVDSKISNFAINGLGDLKKLTKLYIDSSEVKSIVLNDAPTSSGLEFSAKNCSKLETVNLGGYKLKSTAIDATTNGTSLRNCPNLSKLIINNGIGNLTSQTLDLTECYDLAKVTIKYSFPSADNFLTIDASGVSKTRDELGTSEFIFAATVNSTTSKQFILKAMNGSAFEINASNQMANFKEVSKVDNTVKFIIFKQEQEKFEKMKLWIDNMSTYRRDYESNPVFLRIGETISSNSPVFYNKDGIRLDNVQYTVSIEPSKGTDIIYANVGKNESCVVTAKNTGIAYLNVSTNTGEGSETREQKIIVYDPATSLTMNDSPMVILDSRYRTSSKGVYAYPFYAAITVQDPDMIKYTIGRAAWSIEGYRNETNDWVGTSNSWYWSSEGLSVYTDSTSNTIKDGKVIAKGNISVDRDNVSGVYRATGRLLDNAKNPSPTKNPSVGDYIYATKYFYFGVANVSQSSDTMGYNYETVDNSVPAHVDIDFADLGDFKNFTYTVRFADSSYGNYLQIQEINKLKYRISFKPGLSTKQIGEFIQSLTDNKIEVIATVGGTDSTEVTPLDISRWITLKANFKVDYDLDGGTNAQSNATSYVVPKNKTWASLILQDPSKTDHRFMGWFLGDKEITTLADDSIIGDVTLKAKWAPSLTITYDLDGGTNSPDNPKDYINEIDGEVILQPATKKDYSFDGWYIGDTKVEKLDASIKTNITLKAHWLLDVYTNTLKYDANGGSGAPANQTKSVSYPNTKATFNISSQIPTRSGYTFIGWYTQASGGTKVGTTFDVGEDSLRKDQEATIYAQWEKNADPTPTPTPTPTLTPTAIPTPTATPTVAPTVTPKPTLPPLEPGNVEAVVDTDISISAAANTEDVENAIEITPEEQKKIDEGKDLKLELIIKNNDNITEDSKQKINDGINKSSVTKGKSVKVEAYLDISLFKHFEDEPITDSGAVHETKKNIDIKIRVNDAVDGMDYRIARLHNGKVDVLGKYDSKTRVITMSTKFFSDYAIISFERPKRDESNKTSLKQTWDYQWILNYLKGDEEEAEAEPEVVVSSTSQVVHVDNDTNKSAKPVGYVCVSFDGTVNTITDSKVHLLDTKTINNQKFLVNLNLKSLNAKKANVIDSFGVYPRRGLSTKENGSKQIMVYKMASSLPVNTPIYAQCYSVKDGAYLISGVVTSSGHAVFNDYILRDEVNVTIFTIDK